MDDIKYSYFQDIKDKKTTATGSYHKKGGSKSKKCTLYYETLKGKERKEYMNSSDTTTIKLLNADYKDFKNLTPELQKKQLEYLLERYKYKTICIQEFFDICSNTAWRILCNHELMAKVKRHTTTMSKKEYEDIRRKARKDRDNWFNQGRWADTEATPVETTPLVETTETAVEEQTVKNNVVIKNTEKVDTDENMSLRTLEPSCSVIRETLTPSFFVGVTGKLTGKQLKKRLEGIAVTLDNKTEYSVFVDIKE